MSLARSAVAKTSTSTRGRRVATFTAQGRRCPRPFPGFPSPDLPKGYHLIKILLRTPKTTFWSPTGLYERPVLPLELTIDPRPHVPSG
eukprot:jgi/Botrbrau1/16814/Bobra.150_2s0041.1